MLFDKDLKRKTLDETLEINKVQGLVTKTVIKGVQYLNGQKFGQKKRSLGDFIKKEKKK